MPVAPDANNKVREIIEDAIVQLMMVGATQSVAVSLLAFQSVIRFETRDQYEDLLREITNTLAIWDEDDGEAS